MTKPYEPNSSDLYRLVDEIDDSAQEFIRTRDFRADQVVELATKAVRLSTALDEFAKNGPGVFIGHGSQALVRCDCRSTLAELMSDPDRPDRHLESIRWAHDAALAAREFLAHI